MKKTIRDAKRESMSDRPIIIWFLFKVVGLPDSGFFFDYEGPRFYRSGLKWVKDTMVARLHLDCLKSYEAGEQWKVFR